MRPRPRMVEGLALYLQVLAFKLLLSGVEPGSLRFVIPVGRAPSAAEVIREIDVARASLRGSWKSRLPIGVGFFGYELDAQPQMVKILDSVLSHGVRAIWLSFGEDLGKWIQRIREDDADRGTDRTLIFAQLPTAADAFKASAEWDLDAIVLQGW